ncbi:flagellar hook-associated protein FlgK [Litoribacillus peritrichatus]|uniref:Flagellar hook-associated protein 1 n=1 Tax=Litoribacillus peritrichatus TaxID=718191 RepID=A0ABP7M6U7_9GAMM
MSLINIGLTGLKANQAALATTGHNITNADTPGYTRQRVESSTNPAIFKGGLVQGQGVKADEVARIFDQYINDQLIRDTSVYKQVESHLLNIEQTNKLLSNPETGILNELSGMFDSFQVVADDPSSVSIRNTVVNDIKDVVVRFNQMSQSIFDQQLTNSQQLESSAIEINTILNNIAALNKEILQAEGGGTATANDLLDKRDESIRQLSEFVDISTVETESGALSVFMSNGQNLVVGDTAYSIEVRDDDFDLNRKSVSVNVAGVLVDVTDQVGGGSVAGLLDFQNESIPEALNQLGRIAIVMADQLNEQHRLGMDANGDLGGYIFTDVNDLDIARSRFMGSGENVAPIDRVGNVTIIDSSIMTADDYVLEFTGPNDTNYEVRRLSDDSVVTRGVVSTVYPFEIDFEGVRIELESGSFVEGDEFEIRPTRTGASDIATEIERGDQLALASPIRTEGDLGNLGTASISQGSILDIYQEAPNDDVLLSTFATAGQLSPPLIVKFTSETTYDVLDNSDPANPVSLVPPYEDQVFIPGVTNKLFSEDPGLTVVESTGANAGVVVAGGTNGYLAENLSFTFTDPDTGVVTARPGVAIAANTPAQQIANQLNQQQGIVATARTEVTLSNFVDNGAGTAYEIVINGETLTITAPDVVDADTIAREVNANGNLSTQNIRAFSDGTNVRLESYVGVDITVTVNGDANPGGDTVDVTDSLSNTLTVDGGNSATVGGTIDIQLEEGLLVTSDAIGLGNIFTPVPTATGLYLGYQAEINGEPQRTDSFTIDYNTDGVSDNRNATNLIDIQREKTIGVDQSAGQTLEEGYNQLVAKVGSETASLRINEAAAESVLALTQSLKESVSGVNLDEEAANLIKYEQAYNASAKVIQVAQEILDTLLSTF